MSTMRRMRNATMHGYGVDARVRAFCSPVPFAAVPASWLHVTIDAKTGTGTRRLEEAWP